MCVNIPSRMPSASHFDNLLQAGQVANKIEVQLFLLLLKIVFAFLHLLLPLVRSALSLFYSCVNIFHKFPSFVSFSIFYLVDLDGQI